MTSAQLEERPRPVVWLIARRELVMRLRQRSFVLATLGIVVLIIGFLVLQAGLIGGAGHSDVGLRGQASNMADRLHAAGEQLDLDIDTRPVYSEEEARQKITGGILDAVVSGTPAEPQVMVRAELDTKLRAALNAVAQFEVLKAQLASAGVEDPDAVLTDAASTDIAVTVVEEDAGHAAQRLGIGLLAVLLLFVSIIAYGAIVASGVVEEKSSRVAEVLLTTVRPGQLLLGKVIGIGLVGLIQLLAIAVVAVVVAASTGVLTVPLVAIGAIFWGAVWYALGWFLYGTLFAAAAALASRQEELQGVLLPVTATLTLSFVAGLVLLIVNPHGSTTATWSMVPPLAPIIMPGRIAAGTVAFWEIGLAVLLAVAFAALVAWLGVRVYENAVLRTGSRMPLSEALRLGASR